MADVRLGHYFSDGKRWEFAVGADGVARTAHTGPKARQEAINELPTHDRSDIQGAESAAFGLVDGSGESGASGCETQPEDAPLVLAPERGGLPIVVFDKQGKPVGTFRDADISFEDNLKAALDAAAEWEPKSGFGV